MNWESWGGPQRVDLLQQQMWGHEHHEQVEVTNIGILTNKVGNYKYIWVCDRYLKWLWTWTWPLLWNYDRGPSPGVMTRCEVSMFHMMSMPLPPVAWTSEVVVEFFESTEVKALPPLEKCSTLSLAQFPFFNLFHLFLKCQWSTGQLKVVMLWFMRMLDVFHINCSLREFSTVPIRRFFFQKCMQWVFRSSPCRACVSANPQCSIGPETAPALDFHGEKCAARRPGLLLLSQHSWNFMAIFPLSTVCIYANLCKKM